MAHPYRGFGANASAYVRPKERGRFLASQRLKGISGGEDFVSSRPELGIQAKISLKMKEIREWFVQATPMKFLNLTPLVLAGSSWGKNGTEVKLWLNFPHAEIVIGK